MHQDSPTCDADMCRDDGDERPVQRVAVDIGQVVQISHFAWLRADRPVQTGKFGGYVGAWHAGAVGVHTRHAAQNLRDVVGNVRTAGYK